MTSPRVLFAGTPAFALASLEALVDAGVTPVGVLTQPDRPAGRGKRLTQSPVKAYASGRGIPVLQPVTLKDADVQAEIAAFEPDVMIVAAYGLILPQDVLDIPRAGCLNVHASLLPRWRGAAPIQAAILAGDAETGISLMQMTAGLDCGPVYATASMALDDTMTGGDLHDALAALGGRLLVDKLDAILAGEIDAVAQDDAAATYAGKISKGDARMDWNKDAPEVCRQVRAFNPVPGAWFTFGDLRIKCWQAAPVADVDADAGTVVSSGDGIVVACGSGGVVLEELQRPGKRPVSAREFAATFDLAGQRFG